MADARQPMIPSILAARAGREPESICLIEAETDERISYAALLRDSRRLAARLRALGVTAGSVVATMIPHSIDTYRLWFALAAIGALEVPVGTRYRGRMLDHIINDCGARLLVIDKSLTAGLGPVLSDRLPALRHVIVREDGDLSREAGEDMLPGGLPEASDLALVIYTSGTTGPAKGVLVPWGQIHATVAGAFPPGSLDRTKVIYSPFPPNHVGGRLFACLAITHGVPVVLRHAFSASGFWNDVDKHGCTTTGLVAAMASMLLCAPGQDGDDRHALQDVLMVPLVPGYREFGIRFGVRVCTSFNMTEVSIPIASGWSAGDWRSCGEARPGYQLRIVDADDYPLGPGETGELVCRTDQPWQLNAGYLKRPGETAVAWRNGWFHTGDAFRYDERGRFYFVDRVKDAIRRRGENVSSFEVEREILDHPDVLLCAVIGVPSELGEEDIKAFVLRRPGSALTEAELASYVAAKAASFMVPRYIEFADSLPVTQGTGRVQKAKLRERERRRSPA